MGIDLISFNALDMAGPTELAWTNWRPLAEDLHAAVDDQGNTQECARRSVAKGIQECLHHKGFDGNQDEISQTLVDHFPHLRSRGINTNRFHNQEITIAAKDQVSTEVKMLKVKITVETVERPSGDIPFATPQQYNRILEDKNSCLVLRWCLSAGLHAIYAKSYNPETREFHCLNSWGAYKEKPVLCENDVQRVYRVKFNADAIKNA